jgi:cob(I)alamin adenosyltransferase
LKGYVQVYTGKGKGKTTAAFGLALRAAGAGLRVYFAQFVKGTKYSECHAVGKYLSEFITLKQYGLGYFVEREPNEEDRRSAVEGLREIKKIMCSETYDIIILDEANIAVYYKLFSVEDLLDFIDAKPDGIEIIITGRHADPKVIDRADLITEMKEIKHYYHDGVEARTGIEK